MYYGRTKLETRLRFELHAEFGYQFIRDYLISGWEVLGTNNNLEKKTS